MIVDLSRNVIDIATRIRASFGLKTPDALQAACCLSLESPHVFLTEDRAFSKVELLCVSSAVTEK
ncbi:MAG: type II toxin-antitoxin system VapC family toxin [Chlorobium sp.]|nr:MAG: type II toxin-antitoxin system VapC family toxin [Chlorobium sp.]